MEALPYWLSLVLVDIPACIVTLWIRLYVVIIAVVSLAIWVMLMALLVRAAWSRFV